MNIDPESLKARTLEEVKTITKQQRSSEPNYIGRIKSPGFVDLKEDDIAKTRFNHYQKRRKQALIILQVRLEDVKNRGNDYPSKNIYEQQNQSLYGSQLMKNQLEGLSTNIGTEKYIEATSMVSQEV